MQKENGSVRSSINDKLQFLKQTLASELCKMNRSSSDTTLTITPSQDPHLTSTHHYSHPHTLTQSATGTSDKVENESGKGVQKVMGDIGDGGNKSEESRPNTGNQSVNLSHVSMEPDSIQLVSYNCSSEMEEEKEPAATMEHSENRDDRGNRKGESGNSDEGSRKKDSRQLKEEICGMSGGDSVDDNGDDGDGDRGDVGDRGDNIYGDNGDGDTGNGGCCDKDTGTGDGSVSDIEMVRGAGGEDDPVTISPMTAESRQHSPFVISPGMNKHACTCTSTLYIHVHVQCVYIQCTCMYEHVHVHV